MECPTFNGWTNLGSLMRNLCYKSSMAELMSKVNVCLVTYLSYLPTYVGASLTSQRLARVSEPGGVAMWDN
jgi:hypothetical protein